MKIYRRLTAAGLSAVLISGTASMPAFAVSANPFTWDGTTTLAADRTYYISDSITVDGSFNLPENSKMIIRSGACVSIPYGSTLTSEGTLIAENGASVVVSGGLSLKETADFSMNGSFSSGDKSEISLKGNMLCGNGSSAYFGGSATVAQTGSFSSYGNVFIDGTLQTRSDFNIYGGALSVSGNVNFGGDTELDGIFNIHSDGEINNSGAILLSENCNYVSLGVFTNTNNGYVTDNRTGYSKSAMHASNLALYTCAPLSGIDVSVWQGEIDWAKVKAGGIDFAIIRSSRGPISEELPMTSDTMFHQNMSGAMKNDVDVGVYHYCYGETIEQVRDEARMVLSLIESYDVRYPIIFDIEDEWYIRNGYTKEMLTKMTAAFCEEIKSAGYLPMIYSYASFYYHYLDMEELAQYPVWVAHINTDAPDYDGQYFMWQYSWEGQVDGIEGDVDMNYSYVDFAEYTKQFGLNNLSE